MTIAEQAMQLKTDFDEVYAAGYTAGQANGGDTDVAYQQGVTDGRYAEWNYFWDNFQAPVGYNRYVYQYAFYQWNMRNFKPKHDLRFYSTGTGAGTGAVNAFASTYWSTNDDGSSDGSAVTFDLKQLLDDSGVRLITTGVRNVANMFNNSGVTRIPSLDFSSVSSLSQVFYQCFALETIDEIIVSATTTAFSNAFTGCTKLANLKINGELAKSGQNFAPCTALTHDSLMSIINALKTYTSGTYNINLGSTNLAKLTDAEKAIATEKGWTLA